MRLYLKKSNQPQKPLILWVILMIDKLSILLTHPLYHTKNLFLVATNRISKIAMDKFNEDSELLDDASMSSASLNAVWTQSLLALFTNQMSQSKQSTSRTSPRPISC